MMAILTIVFSNILSYYLITQFLKWDIKKVKNYKGEDIPTSGGIVFIIVQFLMSMILYTFTREKLFILLNLFGILAIGIIGLIDDVFGQKNIKGFKGHFFCFLRGNLTTGFLKAIIGFFVSFFISYTKNSHDLKELIIDTFFICLFINAVNILDMRPGRACKFYIILCLIGLLKLFFMKNYNIIMTIFPILLSVIVFLSFDLKEKVMMGDTGANVLGLNLGILFSWILSSKYKIIILFFLLFLNIFAEKFSISKILDNIGGRKIWKKGPVS